MAEGTHLSQAMKANEDRIEVMEHERAESRASVAAMNKKIQSMNERLTDFMVTFN